MSDLQALEKRIKRHVIGRVREYFIATAPGIEFLCLQELQSLSLSQLQAETSPGGVVFHGRLIDCFAANLYLRTASRVLMRIDSFTATRFHELEKKLAAVPWELFLAPHQEVDFRIRAKKSKLYHTEAIADRFRRSITDRLSTLQQDRRDLNGWQHPQIVFVRVVNDRFTVSLDASGVNLHKRGLKTAGAAAPLRETTAAAVLMLAGYTPAEPLLDPMCGSGSFSLEAALMASGIPAGWFRDFAFTGWPAHRQARKRWEHLKTEAGKRIAFPEKPLVLASDIDSRACSALRKITSAQGFGAAIKVFSSDFFDIHPQRLTGDTGLVVINPPYGRRIETPGGIEALIQRIGGKLMRDFKGWKVALLVPEKSMLRQVALSLKVLPLFHGGLQVYAAFGRVPTGA